MTVTRPTLERPFDGVVTDADEARSLGPEFVTAVGKVIASHVRNEYAGAAAFDEPAIAVAPGPEEKWLACRIAMEEYGHHLRFQKLASALGVGDAMARPALSVFEHRIESWVEFVVVKAVVDLAEVVLMEELADCSYQPLRQLAADLMPEERFHLSFGRAHSRELAADSRTRPEVQAAVNDLVRVTLPFFGAGVSANNELFRRWRVKRRTNDEARAEFVRRSRAFVVDELGLDYPDAEAARAH